MFSVSTRKCRLSRKSRKTSCLPGNHYCLSRVLRLMGLTLKFLQQCNEGGWFRFVGLKKKKKRNYVRYKLVFHSNLTRVALIIMFYSQRAEGQEGFKIPTVINVFRSTKSSVCAVCTAGSSKNISCITRTIGTKLVLL